MTRHSLIKTVKAYAHNCDIKKNSHYYFVRNGQLVCRPSDICYARLVGGDNAITKARIFINQHKRPDVNIKHWKQWMKWVVNESFWKYAFKPLRNWQTNGIALDCSFPLDYVGGAITTLREGYEFPVALDVWAMLVSKGVCPELAHAISVFFVSKDKEGYLSYGTKGHHTSINSRLSKEDLSRYLNKRPYPSNRKPMNVAAGGLNGVFKLFCLDDVNNAFLVNLINKYSTAKGEGWGICTYYQINDAFISELLILQKELKYA